jgi:hypothetical protein
MIYVQIAGIAFPLPEGKATEMIEKSAPPMRGERHVA